MRQCKCCGNSGCIGCSLKLVTTLFHFKTSFFYFVDIEFIVKLS